MGLMMSAVKAAIRALDGRATGRPTATVTMSPRMRKFRNPLSTLIPPWPFRDGKYSYRPVQADHGMTTISCSVGKVPGHAGRAPHLPPSEPRLPVAQRQVAHDAAGAG